MVQERYWIRILGLKGQEVSQEEFTQAKRNSGFYPKLGCGPVATAGFNLCSILGCNCLVLF